MPSSRQLISSQVLGTAAASVTFSAIPSTYTDLVLRYSARSDEAGSSGYNDFNLIINGSSAAVCSVTLVYNAQGTTGSLTSSGNTAITRNYYNTSAATSNTFASGEIYIPSYTVSQNKPMSGFSITENNSTSSFIAGTAGLFRDNTAISSLIVDAAGSTNWVSGSSFYLYGIKSS